MRPQDEGWHAVRKIKRAAVSTKITTEDNKRCIILEVRRGKRTFNCIFIRYCANNIREKFSPCTSKYLSDKQKVAMPSWFRD